MVFLRSETTRLERPVTAMTESAITQAPLSSTVTAREEQIPRTSTVIGLPLNIGAKNVSFRFAITVSSELVVGAAFSASGLLFLAVSATIGSCLVAAFFIHAALVSGFGTAFRTALCGSVRDNRRVSLDPCVDCLVETLAGHCGACDGVDGICLSFRSATLYDCERSGICEIESLAVELCAECRVILDLAAKARGLGSMVEGRSCDRSVSCHCNISPDRAPEACSIDREDLGSVLEDIDRDGCLLRCVGDVVVLRLEVGGGEDLGVFRIEVAGPLAGKVYLEGLGDFILVGRDNLSVAFACRNLRC